MGKYYKILAHININHEFFAGGTYPSVTLFPLPQTLLFLKNHRIILKQKKEGFFLLQEASDETNEVTISFNEFIMFFGIKLNDPHFQIRSGFNYNLRKERIVTEAIQSEIVNIDLRNIMPVIYSSSEVDFSITQVVVNSDKIVVFDSEIDIQNKFNVLDNGVYELNKNKILKYDSHLNFDIILIYTLKAHDENKICTINIPSGSYKFRYHILKKYHSAKNIKLVDENEIIFFEEFPSIENNKFIFVSTLPVKLSQTLSSIISVYENDTVVKKYLPIPEIQNARFFDENDKSLVLEAYVTI